MTPIEVAQTLLFIAASTLAPTPTPADPAQMYPKDWRTIGVLRGAVAAGVVQAWKAKPDDRAAEDAALWEYYRVVSDISADYQWHLGRHG